MATRLGLVDFGAVLQINFGMDKTWRAKQQEALTVIAELSAVVSYIAGTVEDIKDNVRAEPKCLIFPTFSWWPPGKHSANAGREVFNSSVALGVRQGRLFACPSIRGH